MQRRQGGDQQRQDFSPLEFLGGVNSILNPVELGQYNAHLEKIKKYCERLGRDVSTHQLRTIFSKVRTAKKLEEIYPLRYKIAYLAGRNKKNRKLVGLCELLDELIRNIGTEAQLERFQEFFEAIIAYQKYVTGE